MRFFLLGVILFLFLGLLIGTIVLAVIPSPLFGYYVDYAGECLFLLLALIIGIIDWT